jgi:hypothetical protein
MVVEHTRAVNDFESLPLERRDIARDGPIVRNATLSQALVELVPQLFARRRYIDHRKFARAELVGHGHSLGHDAPQAPNIRKRLVLHDSGEKAVADVVGHTCKSPGFGKAALKNVGYVQTHRTMAINAGEWGRELGRSAYGPTRGGATSP